MNGELPELSVRGGRAREVVSIGLECSDGRGHIWNLGESYHHHPPTWMYAELRSEPVESLFLSVRFDRPRPLLRKLYALGMWALLSRRYRPLWLRYRGDSAVYNLPRGALARLHWRDGLVELAAPGTERTSL